MGLRPRHGVCRPVDRSHIPGLRKEAEDIRPPRLPLAAGQPIWLVGSTGHAGLSDALRTVALVPRWEVTARSP